MSVIGDSELLERWAQQGAQEAFTELVDRHVSLVWGTARRITGDPDLARDITQTVFADLAAKASVLPPAVFLPGWLHRAAVHAAHKSVRGDIRRRVREQKAMIPMDSSIEATETEAARTLQPLLDEALAALPDADRDAVLMRYFSGKSYGEIGIAVGASDDTVQKRVTRALEKLRDHFRQRGVTVAAGSVAASLTLAASSPVPAGMASAVATAVLGVSAAASPFAVLYSMKTLVASLTVATGVLAVVAGKEHQQIKTLTLANAELNQQLAQTAAPGAMPSPAVTADRLSDSQLTELMQLRAEVARWRKESAKNQAASVAKLPPRVPTQPEALTEGGSETEFKQLILQRVNAMKYLALAARLHAVDHNDQLPTTFDVMRTHIESGCSRQPARRNFAR